MKRDAIFRDNADLRFELAEVIESLLWGMSYSYHLAVAQRDEDEVVRLRDILSTRAAQINAWWTRFQYGIDTPEAKEGYISRNPCDGVSWMGCYSPPNDLLGKFELEPPETRSMSEKPVEVDVENSEHVTWVYHSRVPEQQRAEKNGIYRFDLSKLPEGLAWRFGLS